MIIAVEFDGTIVENGYPGIGKEISVAIYVLSQLRHRGHQVALKSRRTGKELEEAVEYCRRRGLEFDFVLQAGSGNSGQNQNNEGKSVVPDIVIDHACNLNNIPWLDFFWKLQPEEYNYVQLKSLKKKSFLKRIFGA